MGKYEHRQSLLLFDPFGPLLDSVFESFQVVLPRQRVRPFHLQPAVRSLNLHFLSPRPPVLQGKWASCPARRGHTRHPRAALGWPLEGATAPRSRRRRWRQGTPSWRSANRRRHRAGRFRVFWGTDHLVAASECLIRALRAGPGVFADCQERLVRTTSHRWILTPQNRANGTAWHWELELVLRQCKLATSHLLFSIVLLTSLLRMSSLNIKRFVRGFRRRAMWYHCFHYRAVCCVKSSSAFYLGWVFELPVFFFIFFYSISYFSSSALLTSIWCNCFAKNVQLRVEELPRQR